jgi:PAS domain-containing protein
VRITGGPRVSHCEAANLDDSTERPAEETIVAVREREAWLRSILETVPDAIIVIDECGLIEEFSPAAERLFGYTAALRLPPLLLLPYRALWLGVCRALSSP